jgi:Low molecular weight phosphotyrosine protein phosphatase
MESAPFSSAHAVVDMSLECDIPQCLEAGNHFPVTNVEARLGGSYVRMPRHEGIGRSQCKGDSAVPAPYNTCWKRIYTLSYPCMLRYQDGGWSYHTGDAADRRMTSAAKNRGVHLTSTSRPLEPGDLAEFDYIIGMDAEVRVCVRGL